MHIVGFVTVKKIMVDNEHTHEDYDDVLAQVKHNVELGVGRMSYSAVKDVWVYNGEAPEILEDDELEIVALFNCDDIDITIKWNGREPIHKTMMQWECEDFILELEDLTYQKRGTLTYLDGCRGLRYVGEGADCFKFDNEGDVDSIVINFSNGNKLSGQPYTFKGNDVHYVLFRFDGTQRDMGRHDKSFETLQSILAQL